MERRFHTSLKDDGRDKQRSSKKQSHDRHFRRKNLPSSSKEESSRREYSRFTDCSSEDRSFRSSQERRKETRNSAPTEDSENRPKSANDEIRNFLRGLQALPTEVFLKLVHMKLDQMETDGINGLAELSALTEFINKSREVLTNSLPPDLENVIKQQMPDKTEMNRPNMHVTQPVNTRVSHFERERHDQPQGTDSSFMTELLNQVKRKQPPSASATVASHQEASASLASYQNPQSYPGFSHEQVNFPYPSTYTPSSNVSFPFNTASSNMTPANESFAYNFASSNITPVIPGLTLQEEQVESHSAYNAYQSQNFQPSSKYNF